MFQGLALVDLADLKWGDVRDVEVIDKEKYARDSVIDANQYLYVTSTEAYKEGKEARLERRRAERINEKVDDTFAE